MAQLLKPIPNMSKRVGVILSLPRLAFTENATCVETVSRFLNIRVSRYTGSHWHYGIENLLEDAIDTGYDYIVTVDYDTLFTEWHVIELFDLMEKNPDISAIFPIQNKRGSGMPMFSSKRHQVDYDGVKNESEVKIKIDELKCDLFECDSGHFGLTIIRLADLKKMEKPWLQCIPDENNCWKGNKVDADIRFWNQMRKAGLKVAMAAHLYIGHLQMLCTLAQPITKGWQAAHYNVHDMITGNVPIWYVPASFARYTEEGKQLLEKVRHGSSKKDKDGVIEVP